MQTFLQLVAHDLYSKIGNDLSRTVLVFPNKRAQPVFQRILGRRIRPTNLGSRCNEYQRPVSETIRTENR